MRRTKNVTGENLESEKEAFDYSVLIRRVRAFAAGSLPAFKYFAFYWLEHGRAGVSFSKGSLLR